MKKNCDTKFWGWLNALSWGLSIASILSLHFLQNRFWGSTDVYRSYSLVSDSNAVLALTNGITSFMLFKNLKIKNSKIINTIAASSFGVLLIHANSSAMKYWLWKDVIDCVGHYNANMYWLYAIFCVLAIYAVCTIIDIIRSKTIESSLISIAEGICLKAWNSIVNKRI